MITFIICFLALIVGYIVYGKFVERVFAPDASRLTPAITKADGVDFIPLPTWKIFMIQFLNIAGVGPIFGAIMGAKFGVASYLWIVLGTIFAGATHDYFAGMLSMRHDGESFPDLIGRYLGVSTKQVMRVFSIFMMILVGVIFVSAPAGLLAKLTPDTLSTTFWMYVVIIYYLLATILPIDKVIGKIYPLFAIALIFMCVGVFVMLLWHFPSMPEMTDGFTATSLSAQAIFPYMFVSIACGAISGFHATQSPMMARCLKNEKLGRPVFFGAMLTEGMVALIWAAAATYFFHTKGTEINDASVIVDLITREWLGTAGALLALLGVIAAPISTGDTALRTARLIIADFIKIEQKSIKGRLLISIPLFAATVGILLLSLNDPNGEGFGVVWRYFAWSNQTLSVFTLWAITVYLVLSKKPYFITFIPAVFMTYICSTYLFMSDLFSLGTVGYYLGALCALISMIWFIMWKRNKAV